MLNVVNHWGVVVVRKRTSKAEAIAIDGLFNKDIKDQAASFVTHICEYWFGESAAPNIRIEWARVPEQKDGWSCGHRAVLAFEHLAASGLFHQTEHKKVPLKRVIFPETVFKCLETAELYAKHLAGEDRPVTPPRKRMRRAARCDFSPAAPREQPARANRRRGRESHAGEERILESLTNLEGEHIDL